MSVCMCGGCSRCCPVADEPDDDELTCLECGEPADECTCVPDTCGYCGRIGFDCICDDEYDGRPETSELIDSASANE